MRLSSVGATKTQVEDAIVPATVEHAGRNTLTSGAGAEGAYVEFDAVTAKKIIGLIVSICDPSAASTYEVDIAIGAGGSEVNVIADLVLHFEIAGAGANLIPNTIYRIQLEIAAGVRIAARVEAAGAFTCEVDIWEEQQL